MVPPARSARHGACATMAGPLAAKVALRMRCCITLYSSARDGHRDTEEYRLRTRSGLGLIRLNFCGGGQDLWNLVVYICFRSSVIQDAGSNSILLLNSRDRRINYEV